MSGAMLVGAMLAGAITPQGVDDLLFGNA